MRGPFERLKYDLRRVWECPQCGQKQRTDGSVTTMFCRCGKPNTNPAVAMKLIGDGPRRLVPRVAPPPREPEPAPVAAVTQVEVNAVTAAAEISATEILPPPQEAGPDA